MERKGRKWLRPIASAAVGDEEEDQQPPRHRQGMAQKHGDGGAAWTSNREREGDTCWVKGREIELPRARWDKRKEWAPW